MPRKRIPKNAPKSSTLRQRPATRLGWWAASLTAAYVVMYIVNNAVLVQLAQAVSWRQALLPFYGILMLLVGLAAGVIGLVALVRNRERSWAVWMSILPAALVLFFLAGEFLFPH